MDKAQWKFIAFPVSEMEISDLHSVFFPRDELLEDNQTGDINDINDQQKWIAFSKNFQQRKHEQKSHVGKDFHLLHVEWPSKWQPNLPTSRVEHLRENENKQTTSQSSFGSVTLEGYHGSKPRTANSESFQNTSATAKHLQTAFQTHPTSPNMFHIRIWSKSSSISKRQPLLQEVTVHTMRTSAGYCPCFGQAPSNYSRVIWHSYGTWPI